jgi:hypothetical protein
MPNGPHISPWKVEEKGRQIQNVRKNFLGQMQELPSGMGCALARVGKHRVNILREKGRIMKRLGRMGLVFLAGCLLGLILGQTLVGYGQDTRSRYSLPEGVYIDLTKDFYQALKDEGSSGTKTYSNDPSLIYLREISVAARFMVETNLQILKGQERIIQLLDTKKK